MYRVALGRNGVTRDKNEGDMATPAGCFPIRGIYFREDRLRKPETVFPTRPLAEDDGWFDDAKDPSYNKLVKLPHGGVNESLWREDHLYDVIVVLGYNDEPPTPGKGSAIFMHVARESYSPTAGCIVLSQEDLLEVLKNADIETQVCIHE